MKTDLKLAYFYIAASALLFCVLYTASTIGWQAFDFSYINGLVPDKGDQSQHQLGWEGYRNSPWYFPLGLTDQLSYPTKVSVAFTDSLPLLAVFFKALSPILPESFQYFTLWFLLCFALQALCAAHILKDYTENRFALAAASLFFAASPVMLRRINWHNALVGQWIILFMLAPLFGCRNYLRGSKLYIRAAAAGLLASMIHPYFDMFCGLIVLAISGLCIYYREFKKGAAVLGIYLVSALLPHCLLGSLDPGMVLVIGSGSSALDTSMNLNAFFNSMAFSEFVPPLPVYSNHQNDGFAYLGLGGFILAGSCLTALICRYSALKEALKRKLPVIAALGALSLLSLIMALSPQITFGRHLLLQYTLPEPVISVWAVCKSTGRFVWIFIYILMLSSFILLFKSIGNKWLLNALTGIILAVQIYELPNFFINNLTYNLRPRRTFLADEYLWDIIADSPKIKHIVCTLPFTYTDNNILYSLADLALSSHKTLNCFFFARELNQDIYLRNIREAMEELSEDELFVFFEENKEDCLKYPLKYYFTGQFIVGCLCPPEGCEPLTDRELREIIKDGNLSLITARYFNSAP